MTVVDSGTPGPCDPNAQTGCGAGQKCSLNMATGMPACAAVGTKAAFATCANDGECRGGTICINNDKTSSTFQTGQFCLPFCDPATQAHLSCSAGGSCELVDTVDSTVGFCVLPAATDGGP